MRQFALILTLLAAGLAFAAPAHAASSGVKVVGCESSLDPAGRAATFEGRMRVRKSARKMQMRFTLQTRSAEAPSMAQAGRLRLRQVAHQRSRRRALRLHEARRRARGARLLPHARALPLARRRRRPRGVREGDVAACRQADLRPNLRPLGVEARPGADAQHARYLVPVVNRGRSLAGPFDVVVSVDGTTLTPAQAPELAPGERALVEVQGPPCQEGQMLTVDVDPTGAVDERTEEDNQLSVPCPGAPA